jgi:glycosyltransferase involved in cell wall biosynthesis
VSLIVCTRNRAARLADFVACVASLDAPPGGWELVLVDNASTDSTPLLLEQFAKSAPFSVQCVHAPLPGLSSARNAGLARARGDILAFTDDDC